MRRGNTMGKMEYLSCNLYWSVSGLILWQFFFPELVTRWKLLWLFTGVFVLGGIALTWKNRRNLISTLVNVLLPLELSAFASGERALQPIAAGAAVMGAVWLAVVLRLNPREKENRKKVWYHGIAGGRTVFATVFALCCIPLLMAGRQQTAVAAAPERSMDTDIRQEMMDDRYGQLRSLRTENWQRLSGEEKLEILQTVADIEAARLGLPHGLTVRTDSMQEKVAACYNDSRREIRVNEDRLAAGDGLRLAESICHEAYHAYQYRLCDAWRTADDAHRNLACFADAPVFTEEFAHYISGLEDPEGYRSMLCETTAREYAAEAAQAYADYISRS